VRIRFVLLLIASGLAPLRAQARPSGEIAEIASKLDDDDTVEKAYGAMGAQHYARQQWGFTLFDHPALHDWQLAIAPVIPRIVDLLAIGEDLEWTDTNGNSKQQVTSPRREATRALVALERASVDPLLAALDRPAVAAPAEAALRQIVRGGPPEHDRASWQRWWDAHRSEPLHNERGQWWLPAIFLALLGGAVAVVMRAQRARPR
jgi:hypothetical protein